MNKSAVKYVPGLTAFDLDKGPDGSWSDTHVHQWWKRVPEAPARVCRDRWQRIFDRIIGVFFGIAIVTGGTVWILQAAGVFK